MQAAAGEQVDDITAHVTETAAPLAAAECMVGEPVAEAAAGAATLAAGAADEAAVVRKRLRKPKKGRLKPD